MTMQTLSSFDITDSMSKAVYYENKIIMIENNRLKLNTIQVWFYLLFFCRKFFIYILII